MLSGLFSQLGNIRTPDFMPPSGGQGGGIAPQGGWLSMISDLGNQASQASREQDIYNVMDASQALPLINQQRNTAMTQRQVDRQQQQRDALRQLAQQGIGDNPVEYLQKVAAITGDMSPINDYIGTTMGSGRPALLRTADDYLRAKQTGDTERVQALEMFGKIFDKGVVSQGMRAGMPQQTPDFMPPSAPTAGSVAPAGGMVDDFTPAELPPIPSDAGGQLPAQIPQGGLGVLPGYAESAASIEAAKTAASERAKLQEQLNLSPTIEGERAKAGESGRRAGENENLYRSMVSRMPQLSGMVERLSKLGEVSTYTMKGKAFDTAVREIGLEVPDAAAARQEYMATVNNEILPLLRDTFGAQFTEREGDRLLQTLGSPDLSPKEKDAALTAFITTKQNTIESLAREIGYGEGMPEYTPRPVNIGGRMVGGASDLTALSDDEIMEMLR